MPKPFYEQGWWDHLRWMAAEAVRLLARGDVLAVRPPQGVDPKRVRRLLTMRLRYHIRKLPEPFPLASMLEAGEILFYRPDKVREAFEEALSVEQRLVAGRRKKVVVLGYNR